MEKQKLRNFDCVEPNTTQIRLRWAKMTNFMNNLIHFWCTILQVNNVAVSSTLIQYNRLHVYDE